MRDSKEISDILLKFQLKADRLNIPVDCIELWEYYYNQHHRKHGSYKPHVTQQYFKLMRGRENYCFQKINDTLEYYMGEK